MVRTVQVMTFLHAAWGEGEAVIATLVVIGLFVVGQRVLTKVLGKVDFLNKPRSW